MAKVTMHKATDGSLHETAKACDLRNQKVRLGPIVATFCDELLLEYTPGFSRDTDGDDVIHINDLPEFITEHAEQLRKVLAEALVARRPRKPKAVVTKHEFAEAA